MTAVDSKRNSIHGGIDHTFRLPDECLALIFDSVEDRNICKLVCSRWLAVEASYRRKLIIKLHDDDYLIDIPSLLARYSGLSELDLFAYSKIQLLHICLHDLCTDAGMAVVANNCRLLRKIDIGGSVLGKVWDEAIMLTCSPNLRRLHLWNLKVTSQTLGLIATNCRNLHHLVLFRIHAFGDAELSSIAANCISLKTLTIMRCSISDHGIKALANGCPNLVELSLGHYRIGLTCMRLLKSKRASLIVKSHEFYL